MARIVISNGTIHSDDDFNLTSGDDADTRSNFRICKNKESHTRLRSLSSYRIKSSSFTNTGDAPLVISKAYSTCGCTVPSPPKDPIAPGESGVIKVKYDTNRSPGPIRKTITVYTNASAEPYTLKIKGTLLPATN